MTGLVLLLIVVVILVVIAVLFVSGFNRLRKQDVAVNEAEGGIDVQLTRRADLIPNLVNTVKGYASHEKEIFEQVTAARAGVQQAAKSGTVPEKAAAEAQLDRALVNVMAVAENYPDLKASAELPAAAGPARRDREPARVRPAVLQRRGRHLNTSVSTIPWMFFAGPAGVSQAGVLRGPRGPGGTADRPLLTAPSNRPPFEVEPPSIRG